MIAPDVNMDRRLRVCPACGAEPASRSIGKKDGFTWRLCTDCGTRFVDQRPSQEEITRLYDSYYRTETLSVPEFVRFRLAEIVSEFTRYRHTGLLLDVGFGAGALLTAAEAAGWTCWGTEVAPRCLRMGQERDWRVVPGDLMAAKLPRNSFDVVCMTEVIEHLEDPLSYLREASSLLRPGGLLYLTTPNGAGINSRMLKITWTVYSAPEHLQLLSPSSATVLLERAHFVHSRVRTEGLNPCEWYSWRLLRRDHRQVERVQAGFALNQQLSSGRGRRWLKRAANGLLNLGRMGDTLKIYAENPIVETR